MDSCGKTLKKQSGHAHHTCMYIFLFCHDFIKQNVLPFPQYLLVIYISFYISWVGICLHSKWKAEIFFQYWFFFLNDIVDCTFYLYVPANQTHSFYKVESLTLGVSTANWMCSSENEVLLSLISPVPPETKCNNSFADRCIRAEEGSLHLCLTAQVGIAAFSSSTVFF